MTLGEIERMFSELAKMGCRKLHLSGGEPLVRDDIGAIVSAAIRHGLYVGLSTSGVGLPARIEGLRGLPLAFVSLDGPPEVHNAARGRADFDAAARAVDLFAKQGTRVFTTTVVTRRNAAHLDFLLDFARERGILANFVFCNTQPEPIPDRHQPWIEDLRGEVLGAEETREVLARLARKKSEGAPIGSGGVYFDYLTAWPDPEANYRAEPHFGTDCSAGRFFCTIYADGRMYPCGDLYWRQAGRNVRELGVAKAFETLEPIPCRSCRIACYVEQNLVFALNPRATANWLRQKLRGRW